ncbi:uncharacterized protein LOC123886453 [Trifolium pratense]|uniref:uncharacterized protein LOC123886453 n=1 Tax=Trifolium pratense TaxID=57577 RepID=UPI001E693214|nr:uncharacterized protein LOC123886453 [Trifolium pratense]
MEFTHRFTPLDRLRCNSLDWSIKVRVVRMWKVRRCLKTHDIYEIELILLDKEGKKIQATVPAEFVDRFANILFEDGVYMIEYFHSLAIPHYALKLFSFQKMRNFTNGLNYLVDVMGVVIDVFCHPADGMSGGMDCGVRVILADMCGKFECFLSGRNAYELERMLNGCTRDLPILVLLFVRIVAKNGFVFIECIDDVSKVLLNPPYVEVDQFKNDMGYKCCSVPLVKKEYYSGSKSCKELEFTRLYPHKTVHELIHTFQDGLFVLCGKIVGLFKVDQWFYPVCHCGAFLNIGRGSYYCVHCHLTVFSSTSKCSLQIGIQDGTSGVLLPMSENLLEGIESIRDNGSSFALSDYGEKILADKLVLMIVKKSIRVDELSDHVVEVLRITDDIDVIKTLQFDGKYAFSNQVIFEGPTLGFGCDGGTGIVSFGQEFVGHGKGALIEDVVQVVSRKEINKSKAVDNAIIMGGISTESSSSTMRF